jgi:hypothetical protein
MRRLLTWLAGALLGLGLLVVAALMLAVDGQPQVAHRADVSPADVDRAVAIVKMHDPRRVPPGLPRSLLLSERDIDLLVQHAARRWLGADTQLRLKGGQLQLQASLPLPWRRWLNVEVVLQQAARLPEVQSLRIGRLPLPGAWALPALRAYVAKRGLPPDALLALDWIQRVDLGRGYMAVNYRIDPESAKRLRAALVAPQQQERLRAYQERLAALTEDVEGYTVPLYTLLGPLFALAAERSAAGADPVAENRAALLTLTLFANHRPLGLLVPAAYQWAQPRPMYVLLRGRPDTALHFLISAVIAAEDGTPLADAVGLWKELADARRGGSGFSFNDLAADRAGTRFGDMAVRDPLRLHQRLGTQLADRDLLPEVGDLPENLPEAEFVARFGGVGGAGYKRLLADIEARLDAQPLFR